MKRSCTGKSGEDLGSKLEKLAVEPHENSDDESSGSCSESDEDYETSKYIDTEIDGKYVIKEYVTCGGFGIIFKCIDLQNGSEKAIKLLKTAGDEGIENYCFNEIHINKKLCALQNIPDSLMLAEKTFEYDSKHYLVFELMKCNLHQYVTVSDHPNKVELLTIRTILNQLCHALSFLHFHNIVHRDVHPQNILISLMSAEPIIKNNFLCSRDVLTKLSDLGNATPFSDMKQFLVGIQPYKSLELISISAYNETIDIYAAACVCLFLCTGETIFESWSSKEQIDKIYTFVENLQHAIKEKHFETNNLLDWCNENIELFIPTVKVNKKECEFLMLLERMMSIDKSERASAKDVLESEFIVNKDENENLIQSLTYEEFIESLKDSVLINVGGQSDSDSSGKISNSINISMEEVNTVFSKMSSSEFKCKYGINKPEKDTKLLFFCCSEGKSILAGEEALACGYINVLCYTGKLD